MGGGVMKIHASFQGEHYFLGQKFQGQVFLNGFPGGGKNIENKAKFSPPPVPDQAKIFTPLTIKRKIFLHTPPSNLDFFGDPLALKKFLSHLIYMHDYFTSFVIYYHTPSSYFLENFSPPPAFLHPWWNVKKYLPLIDIFTTP